MKKSTDVFEAINVDLNGAEMYRFDDIVCTPLDSCHDPDNGFSSEEILEHLKEDEVCEVQHPIHKVTFIVPKKVLCSLLEQDGKCIQTYDKDSDKIISLVEQFCDNAGIDLMTRVANMEFYKVVRFSTFFNLYKNGVKSDAFVEYPRIIFNLNQEI